MESKPIQISKNAEKRPTVYFKYFFVSQQLNALEKIIQVNKFVAKADYNI